MYHGFAYNSRKEYRPLLLLPSSDKLLPAQAVLIQDTEAFPLQSFSFSNCWAATSTFVYLMNFESTDIKSSAISCFRSTT